MSLHKENRVSDVLMLPDHARKWERGGTPRRLNSRATPQSLVPRSSIDREGYRDEDILMYIAQFAVVHGVANCQREKKTKRTAPRVAKQVLLQSEF